MKNKVLKLLFVGAALLLSGCATMNKEECLSADWQLLGLTDGAKGYRLARLDEHRSACAEYGVSPDPIAYRKGYDEGIVTYCTPANGYQQGLNGNNYYGQCPANLHDAFAKAHEQGLQRYALQSEINALENELYRYEDEIDQLESDIRDKEVEYLQADEVSVRRRLLIELGRLRDDRRHLQYDLRALERDLSLKEHELLALPQYHY
uniref:DUF2799 domain-containing protein n=1 Tax=Thaumasiovibrio occultus TaxID=1891184 RepID=UPI00131D933F|nr:DUF2799 domain-containing protein [Thaumasiovibrio occultus]